MTLYELLHQVSFDEIVPFIERYHGWNALALYKIHYDYLRHLTPELGERTTAVVSNGELDESWPEPHLDAHPLEGDLWEHSLAKELIIEPDVKASLAEIAMSCLWHTSFYGFTEEQLKAKFESWHRDMTDEEFQRQQAQERKRKILTAGGNVPAEEEILNIPSFKEKVKNDKELIASEYLNRVGMIAEFISQNLPSSSDIVSLPVEELCKLFYANHYIEYDYRSYCEDEKYRAEYLIELIGRYEAFEHGILPNALIVLSTSKKYPLLMEEMRVAEHIAEMSKGVIRFIVKTDDTLDKELRMNIAFYEYEEKGNEQCRKLES